MQNNMMNKKSIILLILAMVIIGSLGYGYGNRDLSYLDQSAIDGRIHINKIDELFDENDIDGLEEYMLSLNLKELLETGAELGEEGRINNDGMFLAEYIEDKIVIEELDMLISVISDKRYNSVYRSFILDGVNCSDFYNEEKERINDIKLSIGADKEESEDIRRYALLSLRDTWMYSNDDSGKSIILEIFNDNTSPSEVRSAALTAMNRTSDPKFKETVDSVLSNFEDYEDLTIRHAMIELASYEGVDPLEYVDMYGDIVRTTDNEDNYTSGIYALGLLGGEKSVDIIVLNYGRFGNNRICDYALKLSWNDIQSMIDSNKSRDTILIGIEAARLGKISIALDALKIVTDNSEDEDIVKISKEVIEYIKANPTVDNYEKINNPQLQE